ncbi:WD40-repeat-containing domain protein [Podospora conica]|nr:WD40-repeat-containing domain protein [Schizothecium conicum]
MDDEYGSSDGEQDELMEEADDVDQDNDAEDDNDDDENEEEQEDAEEPEADAEPEADNDPDRDAETAESFDDAAAQPAAAKPDGDATASTEPTSTTPAPATAAKWRPLLRQEYITAPLYDIVPTMAAPCATSVNAVAITPDQRYWLSGGSDGYIRKYNGIETINGKQLLTVAQRHPFVDSVVKCGVLLSYWANEEPAPPNARADERITSPVYSLAVHKDALWLLSGLESGGINLQSVRHDEGKRIATLREGGHTNAVSVLQLAPDERSVLSGSWDKAVIDWDLNNGAILRRFGGTSGQISAIELRPENAAPIPAEASDPDISDTFDSNNHKPVSNGFFANGAGDAAGPSDKPAAAEAGGPSSDHGSLFGSPAGSLFGDNDTMGGGNAFGNDDDEFSNALDMNHGLDHPGDFPMGDPEAPPNSSQANGTNLTDTQANGANPSQDVPGLKQESNAMDISSSQPQPHEAFVDSTPGPAHPANTSPTLVHSALGVQQDPAPVSTTTFFSAAMDGTLRIWDRRVPDPVARIGNRRGVPPWCMGGCWSTDGNWIYAGRRNGTVEEFSIHKARSGWKPERVLKLPAGSGAVSCVRPMVNGRHLVCASHDILRLYDLRDSAADTTANARHSKVPFIVIPGPPRPGVISTLYIDPTSRFMVSAAGTRGWDGSSTETLIGYEIRPSR